MKFANALLFLAGLGVGACAARSTVSSVDLAGASAPAGIKMETLLHTAVDAKFTPGREVVIGNVEMPPHSSLERHWHPGEEYLYILEGEAEIPIDGEPSIVAKAGAVARIPYQKVHAAITREKAVKAVVFRVHTQGEPIRYLAKDQLPGR